MVDLATFTLSARELRYCDLGAVATQHGRPVGELPYCVRVLLENIARGEVMSSAAGVVAEDVHAVVRWEDNRDRGIPLQVPRVILPDSSGLPVLQDIAALRDAIARAGGDPSKIDACIPVDLIVDHSLQVDLAGVRNAMEFNTRREIERNAERYRFLKWAQQAFKGVRVYPPGSGIIHQINLEYIAKIVLTETIGSEEIAYPDFVIGGDSHTPMINGIGVLGWGVGGIDATAAILGQPYVFPIPEVVGVRLTGRMRPGAVTTDLALLVTERLRRENVTGKFVEYFGEGAEALSIPERATIANMSPEYGATCGFFPIDDKTIAYLGATGRPGTDPQLVETYSKKAHLFRRPGEAPPRYTHVVEIDLGEVQRSVAGPRRPQDRLALADVGRDFERRLTAPLKDGGFAATLTAANPAAMQPDDEGQALEHGSVVIAALTSCTNTSNPIVMLAAGLLAKKAVALGLTVPPYVKTSLAPGSRIVTRYLAEAGLLDPLETLGFHLVGYGCTTCGGKSGPLAPEIAKAIESKGLVTAAILSGNRNFEGRIHRLVRANYICSPPLVVAYALAGRTTIDFDAEPVTHTPSGKPVHLDELWPSAEEIGALVTRAMRTELFSEIYGQGEAPDGPWQRLDAPDGARFPWDPASTYLVEPPFFAAAEPDARTGSDDIEGARALAAFGDSITTDHISPGGEIPLDSPAGRYLSAQGVAQADFNTYVARRCNPEVMTRATFANLRIKNQLVPDKEGWFTKVWPAGTQATIFDAAQQYRRARTPIIVLAGHEYGTGSSRDWAAKGTALLGISAVIARSYERIHRANLVGMGVLPLLFSKDQGWRELGLAGDERFDLHNIEAGVWSGAPIRVTAHRNGGAVAFEVTADLLTDSERRLLAAGGILPSVLNAMLAAQGAANGLKTADRRSLKELQR